MSLDENTDAVVEAPDNREFCEQMAAALVSLGTNETLSCMARLMVAIAAKHGAALEFNCDLGQVVIEPKNLPRKH